MRNIVGLAVCMWATVSTLTSASARDEIRIGITGTFTGPAASIGIPYKQAAELFRLRSPAAP
jgi:hypothetical protein